MLFHLCAQYPTEPISHSPRPNRSFSPGHYRDHCRRAHLEPIHAALITHTVPQRLQTFSPRHPVPSVLGRPLSLSPVPVPADGALGIGAWGPRRGSARTSLWGGLPHRVPLGVWSPMRLPRCGPRPAQLSLPAATTRVVVREGHLEGRGRNRRMIWKDRRTGRT